MNREISEITPHLYLSGACPVTEENLRRLGITKVLTIAEELPICPLGKEVDVIKISVRDRPDTNLYLHFEVKKTLFTYISRRRSARMRPSGAQLLGVEFQILH